MGSISVSRNAPCWESSNSILEKGKFMPHIGIIGGAGFIGSNAADAYLRKGHTVTVFDNLSRKGTDKNIEWLIREHADKVTFIKGDIRKQSAELDSLIEKAEIILHLAGQVAVTTSVINPRDDFENNALGTFNVLESVRKCDTKKILIYSSTNKVYGKLNEINIVEGKKEYSFKDNPFGIPETTPLDFYSPYGCSKGAADQYVHDYARIYGMRTIVFRQSCIYGNRQFGVEDQGWIAWFAIASKLDRPITIYGNGKQVRDILYVDDLVEAFEKAVENIDSTAGKIYNIGGGPGKAISLLKSIEQLEDIIKKKIKLEYRAWRPGDQPIYISDVRLAENDFGWKPKTEITEGLMKLISWVDNNIYDIKKATEDIV